MTDQQIPRLTSKEKSELAIQIVKILPERATVSDILSVLELIAQGVVYTADPEVAAMYRGIH